MKSLETVQGDERDVILISVGYGRNAQGTMAMRFGPLGAEGGERRLNVLISRAKRRCEVYASITDEDIDLERAKGKGVLRVQVVPALRQDRAPGDGGHDAAGTTTLPSRSKWRTPSRSAATQVHAQVGIAGFFIDLALADPDRPGRYVLGVECDGASYHSSRSARDRDRLRQAVLEDHGWIIHRIWSTDWFQRPQEQLDKVVAAFEAAKRELDARLETAEARARAVPVEVVTIDRADVTEVGLSEVRDVAPSNAYVEATAERAPGWSELHEVETDRLARSIVKVVSVEGPVHVDEVVVRLKAAWGITRAGSRIVAAVDRAVALAARAGTLVVAGRFLTIPGMDVRVRDRGDAASPTLRKPEMLPPAEMDLAVLDVARRNFGGSADEMVQEGASSDSEFVTRMAFLALCIEVLDGLMDGDVEVGRVLEGPMGEVVSLEVAPCHLDVVQLGSVSGQPLDGEPGTRRDGGRGGFAGVNGPVVEHEHDGSGSASRLRAVAAVQQGQQSYEVGAALGGRGVDDQVARRGVEHPHDGDLARLTRGGDAQVRTARCPGMGQIGMGQGLALVAVKQHDVTGLGLGTTQLETQSHALHLTCVLPPLQRVAGAAPAEPPFSRSRMLSREVEMLRPVCRSISACSRGSVQLGRFSTGSRNKAAATARACSPLAGERPGASVERRASTPPSQNHCRQWRTESAVTPKASATSTLVQPVNVSSIARARSASPRTSDRAKASKSARCAAVAAKRDRPTIKATRVKKSRTYHPCDTQRNPARSLGFRTVGAQLREVMRARVSALESEGRLVRAGDVLIVPDAGPLVASAPSPDPKAQATMH